MKAPGAGVAKQQWHKAHPSRAAGIPGWMAFEVRREWLEFEQELILNAILKYGDYADRCITYYRKTSA